MEEAGVMRGQKYAQLHSPLVTTTPTPTTPINRQPHQLEQRSEVGVGAPHVHLQPRPLLPPPRLHHPPPRPRLRRQRQQRAKRGGGRLDAVAGAHLQEEGKGGVDLLRAAGGLDGGVVAGALRRV